MAKLSLIKRFLDRELDIRGIPDSSRNGLQVRGRKEVYRIGFAVDSCISTFEKAKKAHVDLLIVHHGLKWKPQKRAELAQMRESILEKSKISLYAAHLPLDAHPQYGNNIELARILGLTKLRKFGKEGRHTLGYKGMLKKPLSIRTIASQLNKALRTESRVLAFGTKKIRSIGIVSGAAGHWVEESAKDNLDLYVTGEIKLSEYLMAQDYRMNLIAAGHYATETLGVKALMPVLKEKFNIETVFIDNHIGI